MRTNEGFPAPERDMANVEPYLPPAETDAAEVTGVAFPMLTIAMGLAACLWGAIGLVVEGNPPPTSALVMLGAGVCFTASGVLMLRTPSLLPPVIAAACGIALGAVSQSML